MCFNLIRRSCCCCWQESVKKEKFVKEDSPIEEVQNDPNKKYQLSTFSWICCGVSGDYEGEARGLDPKRVPNGYGTYKVGETIYQGDFFPENFHGTGRVIELTIITGDLKYVGETQNLKRSGEGKLFLNGKLIFEGMFDNDLKHGIGYEINPETKEETYGRWDRGRKLPSSPCNSESTCVHLPGEVPMG